MPKIELSDAGLRSLQVPERGTVDYTITWNIHNAADYGVPQNRLRVFIVGTRNDVAVLGADSGMQYHIGGVAGPVHHPSWYAKTYKLVLEPWEKLHEQARGKAVY